MQRHIGEDPMDGWNYDLPRRWSVSDDIDRRDRNLVFRTITICLCDINLLQFYLSTNFRAPARVTYKQRLNTHRYNNLVSYTLMYISGTSRNHSGDMNTIKSSRNSARVATQLVYVRDLSKHQIALEM